MTQRNNSAGNRWNQPDRRCLSKRRFASTLPAQSLSLLGSLSLLSSGGLVFAQTDSSAIDNLVPTVESPQAAPANPVTRSTARQNSSSPLPETSQGQPEFSRRRIRLKQRLSKKPKSSSPVVVIRESQPRQAVSEPTVVIRRSRPQEEVSVPVATARKLRTRLRATRIAPAITREEKPQLETSQSRVSVVRDEKPQQEVSRQSYSSASAQSTSKDYNNSYIDPTDYSTGATEKYEAPDAIVITERNRDKAPVANTQLSSKPSPSWLRRSQTATLATVPPIRRAATGMNGTLVRQSPRVTSGVVTNNFVRHTPRIASAGVPQSPYRRNRFIPNDFTPGTTVSSVPAPSGDTLTPPVTADNVAPRVSTAAYDIPLATTLPQIAYSGVYAGRPPYGGPGLMFPLSIPAPITSLFGWRTHPITGDRRFHAGTDLGAAMGTPVLAAQSGLVEIADYLGGYGLTVVLNHNNAQQTLYGHMSEILVQPGQRVEQGTVIGRVGSTGNSTGPHLHFEVRQLTSQGWVATDPGAQLEYALGQLVQSLQTAQVSGQPGS